MPVRSHLLQLFPPSTTNWFLGLRLNRSHLDFVGMQMADKEWNSRKKRDGLSFPG